MKKIIIPIITILIFIIGLIITNLFNYTYTTITTYLFIILILVELIIISVIDKNNSLIFIIILSISYLFVFIILMFILLATYGYDVRFKEDYVIRKSLLDFKNDREVAKSPNIFIKSKNKEYCSLEEMCD